jgi:hypothetical protein
MTPELIRLEAEFSGVLSEVLVKCSYRRQSPRRIEPRALQPDIGERCAADFAGRVAWIVHALRVGLFESAVVVEVG